MIKLSDPRVSERAIARAAEVLRTGTLVQSALVSELESMLAEYLGIEHVVVVSSGTAALHIALLSLDIQKGDEVIIPSFTFPATANVVELVGAVPILVDINIDDCCINVSKIEEKISPRTKAVMPVHEFGQSADCDELVRIAKKHKLLLVEDAACALGTRFADRCVGIFGDAGCFSFHPRKAITTGEGGAIVTGNKDLAAKLRLLRNHGMTNLNGKLEFVCPGLNYRMTEFQAALGVEQLRDFDSAIEVRRRLASSYQERLQSHPLVTLPAAVHGREQVFQTYHIILDAAIPRDAVIKRLKQKGIESNYGAQAIHMCTFYREKYGFAPGDFPNAKVAYEQGLALPMGIHLTTEQVNFVATTLIETLAETF